MTPCAWAAASPSATAVPISRTRLNGKRAPAQEFAKGFPGQEFHDREADPVLRADVEDGDEVRVGYGREHLGLALESCEGLRRIRKALRQHFDGHVPIESPVPAR